MSKVAADKKKKEKPASYFGTKSSLQRRPAEGALAQSRVLSPSCSSARLALHQCRKTDLIFHILGDRELRDGFLDPQSGESCRWVGVPALSHQFAHHPESLADSRENTIHLPF